MKPYARIHITQSVYYEDEHTFTEDVYSEEELEDRLDYWDCFDEARNTCIGTRYDVEYL